MALAIARHQRALGAGCPLPSGTPAPKPCIPAAAARLYAAADAAREVIDAPRPPRERAAHEQAIETVRRELGGEAFAAAWTEGGGITLEQACEHAHRAMAT